MKKMLTVALVAILGGSCLCGNVTSKEATYCDDGIMPLAESNITINYESKDEDTFSMALKHPSYAYNMNPGDCACIAGANVIGFYDRYDENLIPDHTSGKLLLGKFIYNAQDTYVNDVIRQLYVDMGTDDEGTTVTEFKNGMTAFCNRKGKSISFTSCMNNNQFDYSSAMNYMKENRPVVLFCSSYNVANISTNDKSDEISYYESSANHVMVGFGYKVVNYTLASSAQVVYRYMTVAACIQARGSGYYNIDYNTQINDAYAINIY